MALRSFCMVRLWLPAKFCRHIQILFWLKILKGHEEYYSFYSRHFCSFSKKRALHRPQTGSHTVPMKQRNGNFFCQSGRSCFLSQGQCLQLSWWEMMLSIIHFLFASATLFSFVPPRNPSQNSRKILPRTYPPTVLPVPQHMMSGKYDESALKKLLSCHSLDNPSDPMQFGLKFWKWYHVLSSTTMKKIHRWPSCHF